MYNPKAPPFATEGTRTLLKTQYKKIYSICRLFTNNYKEHQRLFAGIIAAAAHSIKRSGANVEKSTLLLQACINMAALHSLNREMEGSAAEDLASLPGRTRTVSPGRTMSVLPGGDGDILIQFKSPDYQKSMVSFRHAMGELADYQKILLFLNFEHVPASEIPRLSGLPAVGHSSPDERIKKSFIPYLKEN
jgi:hypothetical protein